ncbi:MAG: DUF2339 domain-containing protein, partial [Vicinamibacterales bacterium]
MFTLFVGFVALALWLKNLAGRVNQATARITQVEQIAAEVEQIAKDARAKSELITRLSQRISALEAAARPVTQPGAEQPSAVAPAAEQATPVPVQAAPPPYVEPPAVKVPIAPPAPSPAAASKPIAPPRAQPLPDEAWEVTVGGSWLNKIGVLVFVIGLALLIGYSMTHVGPAGRIAIGFAVSLSMLGAGVVLERRDDYRTYAYGLIAGGWGGAYFTTYAMRAVEAARVLSSDVVAIVALSAVAAAMVWHSLRYRSQEVTALAYVVAYATLALTPLGGFSMAASIPLAISILVVAHRFSWPRIQILGIVFTYGLYIFRGPAFGFGALNTTSFTPYFALGAYWTMFEVADLFAIRRRLGTAVPPPSVFLLNAAGLVGSGLLQLPLETPVPLSTFLIVSGVAYLGSAIARARLQDKAAAGSDALDGAIRGSHHSASALAVTLVAWALELRFTGARLVVALLMEAELVFLSGLIVRDTLTRGIGSALAILVGLHAIWLIGAPGAADLPWTWREQAPAAVAALTAVIWYANREWLRSRQVPLLRLEWLFTPVATYLTVLTARAEWQTAYSSLATLTFSLVLLEAGFRRGREYRYQAYTVGAISAMVMLAWFGAQTYAGTQSARDAWPVLITAMAVAYVTAWRIAPPRDSTDPDRVQRVCAAAVAGAFGTAFIVMLEWIVLSPEYVVLAWAATAMTLGVAGLQWKTGGFRWQVYPLLGLALLRALKPVLESAARPIEIASALVVIALLYAFSLAVRNALT